MKEFLNSVLKWFSERTFSLIDIMIYASVLTELIKSNASYQILWLILTLLITMSISGIIRRVSGAN